MKKCKKIISKYFLVFCILIFILNCCLLITSCFPSNMIEGKVKESALILKEQGNQPQLLHEGKINDNYTDSIMVNMAYSIDSSHPLYSYMSARKNYKQGITNTQLADTYGELISVNPDSSLNIEYDPVGELYNFVNGDIDTSIDYARYYHGWLIFLRPLLLFFNITQIRILNIIVFTALFIILEIVIFNKYGWPITAIFFIAFIIYDCLLVPLHLGGTAIFIIAMVSSIIVAIKDMEENNLYLLFFVVGCISNYFDLLTVPLVSLALPLFLYILKEKQEYKKLLLIIVISSLTWLLGYTLTWFSKWILCDLFFKKGIIADGFKQGIYRCFKKNFKTKTTIINAIGYCLEPSKYIFTIGSLLLIIYAKKWFTKGEKLIKKMLPVLLISVMPFMWSFVLKNHTVLHTHFVYRHMIIFLIGMMICLWKIIGKNDHKDDGHGGENV